MNDDLSSESDVAMAGPGVEGHCPARWGSARRRRAGVKVTAEIIEPVEIERPTQEEFEGDFLEVSGNRRTA